MKIILAENNGPSLTYGIQASLLRDAVWVHASDGSTVGRFGRMGIDIHTSVTEQMNGAGHCPPAVGIPVL